MKHAVCSNAIIARVCLKEIAFRIKQTTLQSLKEQTNHNFSTTNNCKNMYFDLLSLNIGVTFEASLIALIN